jgi:hypothetical protein
MKKDFKEFKKGDYVFVKGPYINDNVFSILRLYVDMKKILGLPYINVDKISLKMSDVTTFMCEHKVLGLNKKYYVWS